MDCREIAERRDERIDGDLPPDVAAAWDAHLDACAECQEREEALRVEEARWRAAADVAPVGAGFTDDVMKAVRPPRARGAVLVAGGVALAAAAAILIAVLGAPAPFVVERAEGDVLRLAVDGDRWEAIGPGAKLAPDDIVVIPPVSDGAGLGRAWLAAETRRVTLDAEALVLVGAERLRLVRGRARVTTAGDGIEVVTAYGVLHAESADFAVALEPAGEPAFLVDQIRRYGWPPALGVIASVGAPAAGAPAGLPAGAAEVVVRSGEVHWRAAGARGVLGPGESIRLTAAGAGAAAAKGGAAAWAEGDFRAAARLIPLTGEPDPVARLVEGLDAADVATRVEAARGLGSLGGTGDAVRALRAYLERDPDESGGSDDADAAVRIAVLQALRSLDRSSAADAAARSLTDGSPDVRLFAIELWGALDGDPARLERFVDDEERIALRAVAVLRAAGAKASLRAYLESPSEAVRAAAREAMDD